MSKKTELTTNFVCIATSGKTADGREISAQHLKEMAQNYAPEKYTANIWPEHYRWANLGQVVELKAEDAGEKTKLYARLAPSLEMIARNKEGRGLFTSIEIDPQFADTNQAYLIGLAVTDSPASLGTTQLNFARIGSESVLIGEPHAVRFSFETPESHPESKGFMQAAAQFFKALVGQHDPSDEGQNKIEPTITVSATEFKAMQNQLTGLTEKLNQFTAQFSREVTQVPHGGNPVEEENQFKVSTAVVLAGSSKSRIICGSSRPPARIASKFCKFSASLQSKNLADVQKHAFYTFAILSLLDRHQIKRAIRSNLITL